MSFSADEKLRKQWRAAHRDYWQALADRGVLVGGGLWPDENGGLLVCRAAGEDELWTLVRADPYALAGVMARLRVRRWNVMMGERLLDPPEPDEPPDGPAQSEWPLTAHEHRIARLVLDGMTNQEIATHFRVSSRAVELHLTSMYRKLGISRRAQLALALTFSPLAA
ncbi:LuxR C-terminal-related transcriptional regulator [Winogradskya consettensis]|nr:LuxR C-terminal-related transcriptional regulator [Actinoplanes consettensis]